MGKKKSKYPFHDCERMPESTEKGITDIYKIKNTWYAEHDGAVIPEINNCLWCGADLEAERIADEKLKYNINKKIQIRGEIERLKRIIDQQKSKDWSQAYIMELEAKIEHLKQKLALFK